tara:strand:- start:449 stop:697 length:249 start_codon:yes stop_codon:yes gene_type:complete
MIQIKTINKGANMDLKEKQRLLDNLQSLSSELENTQSCRGWKDYHKGSEHDEIIMKVIKVEDHISDLIEEIEEEINSIKEVA